MKVFLVLLVIAILFTASFSHFYKIYNNDHVDSTQHDYEAAILWMLNDTPEGEFTVVTTRTYQMAFYGLANDENRQMYFEYMPENESRLRNMLAGNFSAPDFLIEAGESDVYNTSLPPVKYVVIHERKESGVVPGYNDYNSMEFMLSYPNVVQVQDIPSRFPNSVTYIYEVGQ